MGKDPSVLARVHLFIKNKSPATHVGSNFITEKSRGLLGKESTGDMLGLLGADNPRAPTAVESLSLGLLAWLFG